MSRSNKHALFHVGDRVKIDFGRHKIIANVVEDLGPIGVKGRRLYRIEIPMDPFESEFTELAEEEMETVPAGFVATIDKAKAKAYLEYGALRSILQSNLLAGKNYPRVWLCPDNVGNVTHTFAPERGVVGGQIVPYRALRGDKIIAARRDEVASFVESFGLTRQEAEDVLSKVGTAS